MEILICILCFINGAALSACVAIALWRREKPPEPVIDDDEESRLRAANAKQWENFINYNGTAGGQKKIDY